MAGLKQVLKLSWDIADKSKNYNITDISQTATMTDDRTRIQALALANDCYKYIMDLTTNGVVITDAIKFVQTNKERLTTKSAKEENRKESKEPDYEEDEDKKQLEGNKKRKQENLIKKQQIRLFDGSGFAIFILFLFFPFFQDIKNIP